MQNLMLITKMASFLGFETLQASKIAYKVWAFGRIPGDGLGQPAAAGVGWPDSSLRILSLAQKTS